MKPPSERTHLVEVDDIELLVRDPVVESSLLTEVDDLEGLEDLGELSSRDVGVDIEDLALPRLGKTGEDGKSSSANGRLDRLLVDARDAADVAVPRLVEVLGREDASGDGAGAGAESFESRDEAEVLGEEDSAGVREGAGVGDSDPCVTRG